jgi:outer membrane protein OmpA-like peptidoglycan-associated protein
MNRETFLFTTALTVSLLSAGCARPIDHSVLFAEDGDVLVALGPDIGDLPSLGPAVPIPTHDSDGNPIALPRGPASFADEVVEYRVGGGNPNYEGRHPEAALGPPDYTGGFVKDKPSVVTLGDGGSITLRFTDNALVDVPGPDLYVYEVGPDVEATFIDVSVNGKEWIRAGRIGGKTSSIDIASHAEPGQAFSYVRLTDDPTQGTRSGEWPGADIDAVGAVGSAFRIELPGEVLFEHDSDVIRVDGAYALDAVARRILERDGARVSVLGHTDDTGEGSYNLDLSSRRAEAVARYLEGKGVAKERLSTEGLGESRPVADNATGEGRQKNRRVEILIEDR